MPRNSLYPAPSFHFLQHQFEPFVPSLQPLYCLALLSHLQRYISSINSWGVKMFSSINYLIVHLSVSSLSHPSFLLSRKCVPLLPRPLSPLCFEAYAPRLSHAIKPSRTPHHLITFQKLSSPLQTSLTSCIHSCYPHTLCTYYSDCSNPSCTLQCQLCSPHSC